MPDPEQQIPVSSITNWIELLSQDDNAFQAALEDALAGMSYQEQSDFLRMLNGGAE